MKSATGIERFDALDSWRGLAAIMVVIYHFIYVVRVELLETTLITNAYLFVDFFFVLSGFVVCHAYRSRLGSGREVASYLIRRAGRLWPLHLAVLFAMMATVTLINIAQHHPDHLLIEPDTGTYSLHGLLLSAGLLNAFGLQGIAWNGPAWSIGAEFYTYAVFAVVMVVAGSRHLLTASIVLSIGAMAAILLVAPAYMNSTADYGFIRCIAGFFAGVAAYHLHRQISTRTLPLATVWELAAVMLAGLFIIAAGRGPDDVSAVSVGAPIAFAVVVMVFAQQAGKLSKVLHLRPLRALGEWSYSVYLIHMPLLVLIGYGIWLVGDVQGADLRTEVQVQGHAKLLYDLGQPLGPFMLLAGFVAVTIALSALCHRAIEIPWRDKAARIARNYESGGRTFSLFPSRSVSRRSPR